ncbi:MAG TPA: CinA family protein [Candidatus Omnitrophota bacterium]|nr:CinA family protein [Candidatus Omnitrophota bacterium]HQQ06290.1 CinA family protein [Candidatus Omnitrophota bacterium]
MQDIVQQIHTSLLRTRMTIAAAESCTGGLLSCLLTSRPGSSAFFVLGAIVYSNEAKRRVLGIPRSKIEQYGAVSRPVAMLMARRVRLLARTDIGMGITGIAGPGGGSLKKPIGTVYIAVHAGGKVSYRKFRFRGSRTSIRKQAAYAALKILGTVLVNPDISQGKNQNRPRVFQNRPHVCR